MRNKNFANSSVIPRSTSLILMFMAIDDYFAPFPAIPHLFVFHLWFFLFYFSIQRLEFHARRELRTQSEEEKINYWSEIIF